MTNNFAREIEEWQTDSRLYQIFCSQKFQDTIRVVNPCLKNYRIPYFFYGYLLFYIFAFLNPLAFILTMSFLFKSFRYLSCIFRPRRKSLLESFSDLTSRMFRKPSLDEPDFCKPSLVEPNFYEHEPSKDRQPFMQFVTRSRVSRTAI